VDCIDLPLIPDDLPFGKLSAKAGDAAYRFVELAVELAQAGRIDAICTAPLNKEALHAAGTRSPGTPRCWRSSPGRASVVDALDPKMRVIHVTAHMGLLDAIERIDAALVERTIRRGMTRWSGPGSSSRGSACAASTRTPARAVCSAVARKARRCFPASRRRAHEASTSKDRCRPTRCSTAPDAATSTW